MTVEYRAIPRLRGQRQSQQLALICDPDFARGGVNPNVIARQTQLRQFDHRREGKVFGIILPKAGASLLSVVNHGPELVRLSGRLQLASSPIGQWREVASYRLNGSGLRVEQIIERAHVFTDTPSRAQQH